MITRDSGTSYEDGLLWTIEEIGHLVSPKGDPAETLTNVVHLIQRRFNSDVCSVYLLESDRTHLVLAATVGLAVFGVAVLLTAAVMPSVVYIGLGRIYVVPGQTRLSRDTKARTNRRWCPKSPPRRTAG